MQFLNISLSAHKLPLLFRFFRFFFSYRLSNQICRIISGYLVMFFFYFLSFLRINRINHKTCGFTGRFYCLIFAKIYNIKMGRWWFQHGGLRAAYAYIGYNKNNNDNIILLLCGHNYGGVLAHASIYISAQ